jgi:protein-histidine pros-kinase
MVVVNESGTIVLVNAQLERLFGYTRKELLGSPVETLVPSQFRAGHPAKFAAFISNASFRPMGSGLELYGERKDGSVFPVEISLSPVETEQGLLVSGAVRDITERKREERKLQAILNSAPDAMVVVNQSGAIVLVNAQLERLFGYAREELLDAPVETLVPRQFRESHPQKFSAFISNASFRPMGSGLELYGERKDGTVFPVEISLSPVETEQGLLVSGAVRDITERKKEERKLQAILNSAPDAMVVTDEHRRIVLVNDQVERLFGYSRGELIGALVEVLIPERFRAGHPEKFAHFVGDARARPMGSGLKLFGQRKDGSEFAVEISISPVQTDEGLLVSSAIRDVSARDSVG